MNFIKVSVCIPVYNVEKYIARCVHSLMEQTISGLELIFVDDCSPDNSIHILEETLKEYKRDDIAVKIIRHEKNKGVTVARQTAMNAVTGKYFIHCDPDDEIEPTMYQTMYDTIEQNNADMVYCDFCFVYKDGKIKEKREQCVSSPTEMIKCILSYNCSCWGSLCNKLWKKSLKESIFCPDDIIFREDDRFSIQMLRKCQKVVHIPFIFYKYYCNPGSICTARKQVHFYCTVQNLLFYKNIMTETEFLENVLPYWQLQMIYSIRNSERCGKRLFKDLSPQFKRKILSTPNEKLTRNDFLLLRCGFISWELSRFLLSVYSVFISKIKKPNRG